MEWRRVPGTESAEASKDGQIRVLSRGLVFVLKPYCEGRYCSVRVDGRTQNVHRLVCAAFHGAPPNRTAQTRHLNGNPKDNRAENLAWGSNTENQYDRFAHGTAREGEGNYRAKLKEDDVLRIMSLRRQGLGPSAIRKETGKELAHIKHVIYGQAWNWLTGLPRNRH